MISIEQKLQGRDSTVKGEKDAKNSLFILQDEFSTSVVCLKISDGAGSIKVNLRDLRQALTNIIDGSNRYIEGGGYG
jgi:hypothetical protein